MGATLEATTNIFLDVTISEQILANPELNSAVAHATQYLKELLDAPNMKVDRRKLDWYFSTVTGNDVCAKLSEWDRYGNRQALMVTNRAQMLDPVSRDISISQLLRQLLRQQFFQIGAVIDRGIEELEAEELRNGHAD
jgi:hypothetical protein